MPWANSTLNDVRKHESCETLEYHNNKWLISMRLKLKMTCQLSIAQRSKVYVFKYTVEKGVI